MKSLIFTLFLAFSTSSANADENCSALQGTWKTGTGAKEVILQIQSNCKAHINKMPAKHVAEGIDFDFIFKENSKYRIQYRYQEDYVDAEGTRATYPLPAAIAKKLQGDLDIHKDGSISPRLDFIDEFCARDGADPRAMCPNTAFLTKK